MKRRSLLVFGVCSMAWAVCPGADKDPVETGADPLVGKWVPPKKSKSQKVMVFRANGTGYYYYPNVAGIGGKWSVSPKDNRKYKVVWGGGTSEAEFRIGTDGRLRNIGGDIIAERFVEE